MNKLKPSFKNLYLNILFILLIGGIGVQTFTSCSSDEASPSNEGTVKKASISGVSQKGPFTEGSTITLYELDKDLAQTGRSFKSTIINDKGSFEIRNIELVSPYAMFEANGFYRNENTGNISAAPITLLAIADVREKDNVNVNILTHLEYYRVLNLVEGGMSVVEAKKQAQKEIFAVFGINSDAFKDSEDMSIFGSSDGDAALLAISVLLQGNLPEGEFSQRLANFSQSIRSNGTWSDEAKKTELADWAYGANFGGIRSNILGWGLASVVPDFEKYVYDYWVSSYGLGACGVSNDSEIKKSNRDVSYICKSGNWIAASEYEKDIYQWACSSANVGEIKKGNASSKDYVCENNTWRIATNEESDVQSVCLTSNNGEIKKGNVSGNYYICKNASWAIATEYERDVYQWACSSTNEGEIKVGNVTSTEYICKNTSWAIATEYERDVYQLVCSSANMGEIKKGNASSKDYICENNTWRLATEYESDTYQWDVCSDANIGEIKKGNVSAKDYVCKYGSWKNNPNYKDIYCFTNDCQYFTDSRDNQRYAYVTIGEQTWMAENLNYNDIGSRCYDDNPANCDKYGRLYNWSTAMNVCPFGWHLPSTAEWGVITAYIGGREGKKLKATSDGGTDEYGFSALSGGYYRGASFYGAGYYCGSWWFASEADSYDAYGLYMYYSSETTYDSNTEKAYWAGFDKSELQSVRCLKD